MRVQHFLLIFFINGSLVLLILQRHSSRISQPTSNRVYPYQHHLCLLSGKELKGRLFLEQKKGAEDFKRFYKAWKKACEEAGIGVKTFHDNRRIALGHGQNGCS